MICLKKEVQHVSRNDSCHTIEYRSNQAINKKSDDHHRGRATRKNISLKEKFNMDQDVSIVIEVIRYLIKDGARNLVRKATSDVVKKEYLPKRGN
jgi:hypothetical protein